MDAANGAASKKQKRAPRACDPCRNRKIRCSGVDDENKTCVRCQHLSLNCTFDLPIKRPAPSSTVEELQNRIKHLENQLREAGLSSSIHPDDADRSSSYDEDDSPGVADGQHLLGAAGGFVPAYVPSEDGIADQSMTGNSYGYSSDEKPNVGDTPTSTYSFLGSSSALFPLTITKQIPQTLKAAARARSLKKIVRLEFWGLNTATFDEALDADPHAFWPDATTARSLVDAYFDHLAARHPLGLDQDDIWAQYQEGPRQTGSDWRLGRLYAIFAFAAWHAGAGLDLVNNRMHLAGLQWYLASRRRVPNDTNLTHPIATAQTLVLQACFAMSHPPYIGIALRLAGSALCVMMDIGGHRQTIVKQQCPQTRIRQLTFWTAYVLEKTIVTMSGRPSCLWSEWVDASLPDGDAEEYSALWMEAQVALLTEKILKAKYTAERPSARAIVENVKQIDTQFAFLSDEFERRKGSMDAASRGTIQIGIDGIVLLLHQPELLARPHRPSVDKANSSNGGGFGDLGAFVTPATLKICVRAINSMVDVANDLDIGLWPLKTISATCRAAVLSQVMAHSERKDIREAFTPLKAKTVAFLRKGESRWMCSGKLGDLCAMKPMVEEIAAGQQRQQQPQPARVAQLQQQYQQQYQQQQSGQPGGMIVPKYEEQAGSFHLGLPTTASPTSTTSFADLMPAVSTPSTFSGMTAIADPTQQQQGAPWPLVASAAPTGTPDSASMTSGSGSTAATTASSSFDSYSGGGGGGGSSSSSSYSSGSGDPWTVCFPTLDIEWPIHSRPGQHQQQQHALHQHQQQPEPQAGSGIDPFVFGVLPNGSASGSSNDAPISSNNQETSPTDAIFWNFDFGAPTAGWF